MVEQWKGGTVERNTLCVFAFKEVLRVLCDILCVLRGLFIGE